MTKEDKCAAILLAAGAARRFGGDKLAALIDGESVLHRSVSALARSGCGLRAAVLSEKTKSHAPELQQLGFEPLINDDAEEGLSASLRKGVSWAQQQGATSVLIALADMPLVSPSHFASLFERALSNNKMIAYSLSGKRRSPPAIFGATYFAELRALQGDEGARAILSALPEEWGVVAAQGALRDIDTVHDLQDIEK